MTLPLSTGEYVQTATAEEIDPLNSSLQHTQSEKSSSFCGRKIVDLLATPFLALYHISEFLYYAPQIFCNFSTTSTGPIESKVTLPSSNSTLERLSPRLFLQILDVAPVLTGLQSSDDADTTVIHEKATSLAKACEPLCALLESKKESLPLAVREHARHLQEAVITFRVINKYGSLFGKKISSPQVRTFQERLTALKSAIETANPSPDEIANFETLMRIYEKGDKLSDHLPTLSQKSSTASQPPAIENTKVEKEPPSSHGDIRNETQQVLQAYKNLKQDLEPIDQKTRSNKNSKTAYQDFFEAVAECTDIMKKHPLSLEHFCDFHGQPLTLNKGPIKTVKDLVTALNNQLSFLPQEKQSSHQDANGMEEIPLKNPDEILQDILQGKEEFQFWSFMRSQALQLVQECEFQALAATAS